MYSIIVMGKLDSNSEIEPKGMEYRKVIVNIPKPLLDTFDLVCQLNFYTRKEAVKQSMREFIREEMGDEWNSPVMQKYEQQAISGFMESLALGAARASQHPEIKKAQQLQQNPQLQATSSTSKNNKTNKKR